MSISSSCSTERRSRACRTFSPTPISVARRSRPFKREPRAEHGHFNIIHHETGFNADLYPVGRGPLHVWALPRAHRLEVAGEPFIVAPPEYVIVRKLDFYREGRSEKHLRDIRSMLDIAAGAIDRSELGRLIGERGLEPTWKKTQDLRA